MLYDSDWFITEDEELYELYLCGIESPKATLPIEVELYTMPDEDIVCTKDKATRRTARYEEAKHRERTKAICLRIRGEASDSEGWNIRHIDHGRRKRWGRQDIKLNIGRERKPRVKGKALL